MAKRHRPEPVRILYAVIAALSALLGVAGLSDWVSDNIIFGCTVALAILTAIAGEMTRSRVTPVSDPRDEHDRPLVPAPGSGERVKW